MAPTKQQKMNDGKTQKPKPTKYQKGTSKEQKGANMIQTYGFGGDNFGPKGLKKPSPPNYGDRPGTDPAAPKPILI